MYKSVLDNNLKVNINLEQLKAGDGINIDEFNFIQNTKSSDNNLTNELVSNYNDAYLHIENSYTKSNVDGFITTLQNDDLLQQNKIDSNELNITTLQNDLSGSIVNLQSEIDTNKTNITNLETQIIDISGNLSLEIENRTIFDTNLQSEINTNKTNITNLETQIFDVSGNLSLEIENRTIFDTNLQSEIDTNKTNITNLETQILDISGNLSSEIENRINEDLLLQNHITTLQNDLSGSIVNLQSEIDTNKTNITNLENDLSGSIVNLQSEIDTNKTNITNLETQILDISGNLSNTKNIRHPPLPLTSNDETNEYGRFIISASSINADENNSYKAFNVTNTDLSDTWCSGASYNTSGDYTANTNLFTDSPKGEWISIKLPYRISLTSYSITCQKRIGAPRKFNIYGTNDDGVNWDILDEKDNILFGDNNETKNFEGTDSMISTYNKYAIICQTTRGGSNTARNVRISEWVLYSDLYQNVFSDNLQPLITLNSNNITNLETQILDISGNLSSEIENRINEDLLLQNHITTLQNDLSGSIVNLQSEIDTNKTNITNLENDLSGSIVNLQSEIDTNKTNITNLETQIIDISGNLSLEIENRTIFDTNLQSEIDTNKTNITNLETQILDISGNLSSEISNRINENSLLQNQINTINSQQPTQYLTDAIIGFGVTEIVVSLCNSNVNDGDCYLFVDGILVDSKKNTTSQILAGINDGGTSKKYSSMCLNRDSSETSFENDSIYTSCEIWREQYTSTGTISNFPTTTLSSNTADRYNGNIPTVSEVDSCILRFKFSSTLLSSISGILYEGGGSGHGMVIYIYDGVLYAQAGEGEFSGGNVELSFSNDRKLNLTKNNGEILSYQPTEENFTTVLKSKYNTTSDNHIVDVDVSGSQLTLELLRHGDLGSITYNPAVNLTGTGSTTILGTFPNLTIHSTDTDTNTQYNAGSGLDLSGTTFVNTKPSDNNFTDVLKSKYNTTSDNHIVDVDVSGSQLTLELKRHGDTGSITYNPVVNLTGSGSTTILGTFPNLTIHSTDTNTEYTAGSGLSLSGTTFSNSAPDQVVSITANGASSVSGTYPNFIISSTDTDTIQNEFVKNVSITDNIVSLTSYNTGSESSIILPQFSNVDNVSEIIVSLSNTTINGGACHLYVNGFHIKKQINSNTLVLAGDRGSGTGRFYDQCPKIRDSAERPFSHPTNFTDCNLYGGEFLNPNETNGIPESFISDKDLSGNQQDTSNVLRFVNSCVIKLIGNFNKSQHGILFEAGGSGAGIVIYIFNNHLYVQAGKGDIVGGDIEFVLPLEQMLLLNSTTNTTYTAGSGLALSGTTFNNTKQSDNNLTDALKEIYDNKADSSDVFDKDTLNTYISRLNSVKKPNDGNYPFVEVIQNDHILKLVKQDGYLYTYNPLSFRYDNVQIDDKFNLKANSSGVYTRDLLYTKTELDAKIPEDFLFDVDISGNQLRIDFSRRGELGHEIYNPVPTGYVKSVTKNTSFTIFKDNDDIETRVYQPNLVAGVGINIIEDHDISTLQPHWQIHSSNMYAIVAKDGVIRHATSGLDVTKTSTGTYSFTFFPVQTQLYYGVSAQHYDLDVETDINSYVSDRTTSGFLLKWGQGDNGTSVDSPLVDCEFSVLVYGLS